MSNILPTVVPATPSRDGGLPVDLPAYRDFHEASQAVLSHLREHIGFDLWMVTRTEGEDWIILEATPNRYGVEAGQVLPWQDSFCSRMVEGSPQVAPRAADVEAYRTAPIAQQLDIGSYVGVPLTDTGGNLFGTLCAIDPAAQEDDLLQRSAAVAVFAQLLGTILQQELATSDDRRRLEIAEAEALTDALTGLPNRRAWERFVEQEEARCQRFGHPTAVLMLDVDGLKQLNDHDGHDAGDALLRRTGETLRAACRTSDLTARLGGDEFAVLATETDAGDAQRLAERLRSRLLAAGISASIGVAQRRADRTLDDAIVHADQAMFAAKRRSGRGRTQGADRLDGR